MDPTCPALHITQPRFPVASHPLRQICSQMPTVSPGSTPGLVPAVSSTFEADLTQLPISATPPLLH